MKSGDAAAACEAADGGGDVNGASPNAINEVGEPLDIDRFLKYQNTTPQQGNVQKSNFVDGTFYSGVTNDDCLSYHNLVFFMGSTKRCSFFSHIIFIFILALNNM